MLVFDHLSHELSAIASLHTEAADLDGRYRIAERPSSRPWSGPRAQPGRDGRRLRPLERDDGAAPAVAAGQVDTSLGRDAYIQAVEHAKDAIAAGEAIQVVLARRQSFDLPPAVTAPRSTASASIGPSAGSTPRPYLFFTRTPSFEVVGASPELLLQVVGDRMTTHPIAGTRPRGATPAEDDRLADELRGDPRSAPST